MVRVIFLFFVVFLIRSDLKGQSYGLAFNSHESVQEKRTFLDLSPDDSICFDNSLKLEFDLSFMANHAVYFGYVLRLVNQHQNIDIIAKQNTFSVIIGQRATGISVSIDTSLLYNQWNKFILEINLKQQKLQVSVNGKEIGSSAVSFTDNCFKILWGANDHNRYNTRDIPPMRLKDIKLYEQNKLQYHWTLADTSGVVAIDLIHKKAGKIKNPVWIKPKHQHWQLVSSFTLKGNVGIAFDRKKDRLYIAGSDSIWRYNPRNTEDAWLRSSSSHENLLLGNQAIYDTLTDKLYDVFIDQKKVAYFDPVTTSWSTVFKDSLLTEYWHANKFISPVDSSLYVIGGYGQLNYKNTVQRYDLRTKSWDIVKTGGDYFPPRYLAALGTNQSGDTAFIVGGYGSPTGDQMLNPGNYYDLYAYDIRRKSFKKLHSLNSLQDHYVFANSLIIDSKTGAYFGLIFQNGSFVTHLQLIKGSLKEEGFELLGSRIPYSFYDIQSYADLFYSPISKKLIAVTLFYSRENEKEKSTQVKIYTLDFPPESLPGTVQEISSGGKYILLGILGLFVLTGIIILLWKSRLKKRYVTRTTTASKISEGNSVVPEGNEIMGGLPGNKPHEETAKILLFGQFHVQDKDGSEITKSFTPLSKQLFLLILIYTIRNNKGISSEELNELLWHDKSLKDAKNNRSVNLAKLKTILEKLGNCNIQKEGGFWQFHTDDPSIFIDYYAFMQLLENNAKLDKAYMQKLLHLTGRGTFLSQTDYNWLDEIKSGISNAIIDICIKYMGTANLAEEAEFVIDIANCIFYFDRLNENALEFKCKSLINLKRHALANTTYINFTREYKEMYGEEFATPFNEIIK